MTLLADGSPFRQTKDAGEVENTGKKEFVPPSAGYGQDWILIMDDAGK